MRSDGVAYRLGLPAALNCALPAEKRGEREREGVSAWGREEGGMN
jgi:hypothetical protein